MGDRPEGRFFYALFQMTLSAEREYRSKGAGAAAESIPADSRSPPESQSPDSKTESFRKRRSGISVS